MDPAQNSTRNDYVTGKIPFCFEDGNEDVCMPLYFEAVIIGVKVLSLILNSCDMVILCKLKMKIRGTVFHRIIIITSAVDILDVFSKIFTTACAVRIRMTNDWTFIRAIISVHDIITCYKFQIMGLCVFDRWLSLAKPFDYDNMVFVRKFNMLALLLATGYATFTFLKNAFIENDYCLEPAFGFQYSGQSSSNIAALVGGVVSLIIVDVCIVLISKHLLKMRLRTRLTESDHLLKQAAKYVIVTCILYHTCFLEYIVILILRATYSPFLASQHLGLEYSALFSILLNSFYGTFNIISFAWYTAGYRRAVSDLFLTKRGRVGIN